MLEWLLQSEFDTPVTAAAWTTAVAIFSTIVLFIYSLGLRAATILADRRHQRLVALWRDLFAAAIVSEEAARNNPLPTLRRHERIQLLEEWNLARSAVTGDATDNLIIIAKRVGLPGLVQNMLRKRRLSSKLLGLQTLGHLRDKESWGAISNFVDSPNSVLSVTAAVALVDIDAELALRYLVPMIEIRRDWLRTRVASFLQSAGSELISEPLFRAIRSADPENQIYLLKFAPLAETAVGEAIAEDLIRSSSHPGVLGAALELLSGHAGLPRIAALATHEVWYVRLRAAQLLGRAGHEEHLPLLESLLTDREWWVRYRAAQSITSLPFVGPNALRQLRQRQTDPFARDILQQAAAEAGLA